MRYENPESSQGYTPEHSDTVPQPPSKTNSNANTRTFKKGEGDRVRGESHPSFYKNEKQNQGGKPLELPFPNYHAHSNEAQTGLP